MKTKSAGGIVLNNEGKVLIVQQRSNSWSLPKGHLEEGEDALTAAKREIHEEAGIKELTLIKEIGTYQRYRISKDGSAEDKSELKEITLFLFTTNEIKLSPIDSNHPEAKWVEPEKVVEYLTHPKDKAFFTAYLETIKVNHL
ncbi:MAG: NUDIX domain-containing protein [Candidatus Margulisiibacteriota bacterium]|jgi:8-oxo-dGTP pyrophosphatase MutT (NUDIX family)